MLAALLRGKKQCLQLDEGVEKPHVVKPLTSNPPSNHAVLCCVVRGCVAVVNCCCGWHLYHYGVTHACCLVVCHMLIGATLHPDNPQWAVPAVQLWLCGCKHG